VHRACNSRRGLEHGGAAAGASQGAAGGVQLDGEPVAFNSERGLEGVAAKGERDRYRPGERLWVKTKNRAALRFAEELVGATRAG
jgi:hypothetical protein